MSQDTVIKVENLTKTYYLYDSLLDHLKEIVHPMRKKYHQPFNALDGVSLEIKRGETVGIVGKNGSGKSTLLKVITGIVTPTRGTVAVNGRVSALLELGAGFNPELTGLQNVYFNGVISGMTRREIDAKLDDILAFADIGEFVHQPVKSYSSGMFVRLAFSVAIHVDPEILIVDEALAVGDMFFQLKCARKMEELRGRGITMLFVSHNPYAVKNLCIRAVWLNSGKLMALGGSTETVDRYSDFINGLGATAGTHEAVVEDPAIEGLVSWIESVRLLDAAGSPCRRFEMFEDLTIEVCYLVQEDIGPLALGFALKDSREYYICGTNTHLHRTSIDHRPGRHTLRIRLPDLALYPGTYHVDIGLFNDETSVTLDYKKNVRDLYVTSATHIGDGVVYLRPEWIQHESR
jgi:teichoic acid transport system ATP-binding protein